MPYTQPLIAYQVIILYKTHIPKPLFLDEESVKTDIKHTKKAYFEPYFAKYYEFASLFIEILRRIGVFNDAKTRT